MHLSAADARLGDPRLVRLFEEAVGTPFTTGNRIERLRNGDQIFPAMLEAIAAAEGCVELLTYVYWHGDIAWRFAEALAAKAREGVTVRVLLDAWGAATMSRDLVRHMEAGGVQLRWFRPLRRLRLHRNLRRTHRKVLVVDGRVGFTGGVGIAEEWCGDARNEREWRESHFRVRGPAVRGLRGAFYGNWAEAVAEEEGAACLAEALACGEDRIERAGEAPVQVVRSSASYGWSDVAAMTDVAIAAARRSLRIGTAYFTPDAATTGRLIEAARRGVAVEILLPWPQMDARISQLAGAEAIAPLLEAGITIHVFQPTMYHAKLMVLDEAVAIIGSANFNRRSAWQDEEVCLVCLDPALAAVLLADWEEDVARSEPIVLSRWRRRGLWRRVQEAAARLLHPMV
ncbi:phospholipase D-like domain-containing protein [Crenalkalicoccus roseus]|uniref:phospholipase D-like domain-containing protein n=1 Tax=Crenalkalicoccus roseus TaxID=1485588 RepID=UPI0013053A6C|nr:phospholipase D-like domain-containing protein [Crenalkalicoccus roseus]